VFFTAVACGQVSDQSLTIGDIDQLFRKIENIVKGDVKIVVVLPTQMNQIAQQTQVIVARESRPEW